MRYYEYCIFGSVSAPNKILIFSGVFVYRIKFLYFRVCLC